MRAAIPRPQQHVIPTCLHVPEIRPVQQSVVPGGARSRPFSRCSLGRPTGLSADAAGLLDDRKLESGSLVIYLDEAGNVIFDDPTYTYCEDTARDVFRYRTQREFEEWQQRQRPPAEPSP